jgi:DNA-binding response OmpR family regulator
MYLSSIISFGARRQFVDTGLDDRQSAILVVEENRFLCEMICAWLQGAGYAARGVQTEREAAAALEDGGFDLVLLDMDVGPGQASSLIHTVRSKLRGMALVLLTGAVRHDDLVQALAEDAACVAMDKPYSFFALGLVIKAALARSRDRGHRPEAPCACGG